MAEGAPRRSEFVFLPPLWKVGCASYLEQAHKIRIHVIVFIGDIEHRYPLSLQATPEVSVQAIPVDCFHHNDHISPGDLFGRKRNLGIVGKSGGIHFDTRMV